MDAKGGLVNASRLPLYGFLVCVVGISSSNDAVAQEIPTEHFFATPPTTDVTVSPGGRYLAARSDTAVRVLDFQTMSPVGRILRDNEYSLVSDYWWVNEERILITLRLDTRRSDRDWPTHTYFAANPDGKRRSSPYQLFRDGERRLGISVIDPLPDNERNVLIERGEQPFYPFTGRSEPAAMLMDVRGRGDSARLRNRQRAPMPFGNLFADRDGVARFALGWLEGGRRTMFYRDNEKGDWKDISSVLGRDPSVTIRPVGFGGDDRLYVLSNHASDRIGLYRFDPGAGDFELVREDKEYDVADVEWNADRSKIIGLLIEGKRPKLAVIDGSDPKIDVLRQAARALRGESVRIVSHSKDAAELVLFATSDRNPGAWHLMDTAQKSLRPLMAMNRDITAGQMASTSAIEIDARDGLKLLGYLTMPRNATGTVPMVVVPHAGPHGVRDTWGFDPAVQFFANRGFAVLRVNYRGSAGFGRDFERAGYRQWGAAIIDDIVDATRSVAERASIDGDRMCIAGTHFGAFAALAAVAREPDLFRCAAGHAGVYDLALLWGREGVAARHMGDERTLNLWVGRDKAEHRAQSPVHHAERIEVPVFLSHGGTDDRAPVAQTHAMRDALDGAGKTVKTLIETDKRSPVRGFPDFIRGLMDPADAFHDAKDKARLYDEIVDFMRANTRA